jgi:hypothetical protein
MPLDPTQESFLKSWRKKRNGTVSLRVRKPPSKDHKGENPKWCDDAGFEKRYGDPDYYKRITGLD